MTDAMQTIRDAQFQEWWDDTINGGQWTTLERLAAHDAYMAALDSLAVALSEDADDGDILRAEAEFQCDRWLELPRNYSDICPKYGQGDKALKSCGFIDGFLMAKTINSARDERIRRECAERYCKIKCPSIAGSTDPCYQCKRCAEYKSILTPEATNGQ